MTTSHAQVATARAERYIKQLVSHMGNKCQIETTEDGTAVITVNAGVCTLVPAADHIAMTAVASDTDRLAEVEDVIGRHLIRFGAKDELVVDWTPAAV